MNVMCSNVDEWEFSALLPSKQEGGVTRHRNQKGGRRRHAQEVEDSVACFCTMRKPKHLCACGKLAQRAKMCDI